MSSRTRFPLVAGIESVMKCSAFVSNVQIQIVWDCSNVSNIQHEYQTTSEYISTFTFIPSSVLHGTICKCLVQKDDFVSSANLTLDITSKWYKKDIFEIINIKEHENSVCITWCYFFRLMNQRRMLKKILSDM